MASEYSWSKEDILYKTFPEDFFMLQRQIRMRKVDDALMQISIISNPHKKEDDQKEFIEGLMSQRRFMRGEPEAAEQLDVTAFEKMREAMQKESKMIKVK